jgi:NADH:ubiquinone oxidoreductase subunit 6 (subunit J)
MKWLFRAYFGVPLLICILIAIFTGNKAYIGIVLIPAIIGAILIAVSKYKLRKAEDEGDKREVAKQAYLVSNRILLIVIYLYLLAFPMMFFPSEGTFNRTSNTTTLEGVQLQYNRDGTIRHNRDGTLNTRNVYGSRSVRTSKHWDEGFGLWFFAVFPAIFGVGTVVLCLKQPTEKQIGAEKKVSKQEIGAETKVSKQEITMQTENGANAHQSLTGEERKKLNLPALILVIIGIPQIFSIITTPFSLVLPLSMAINLAVIITGIALAKKEKTCLIIGFIGLGLLVFNIIRFISFII